MDFEKIKLKRVPELDFEPTEKDFEQVDIYKLNRTDQVVGKPSKYLVDIIKRFVSNKWAVFFLIIFLLVIIMAIISPPISNAMGYAANKVVSDQVDNSVIINLPARIISGSEPTVTIYNGTSLMISTYKEQGILVSYEMLTPGVYKIVYMPYAYAVTAADGTVTYPLANIYPILGTDGNGFDIWAKLWTATGVSLWLACWVSICSILIGTTYGAIAGAFAGKFVDIILMRFVEIINGVPTIVWLLILGVVINGGANSSGSTTLNNTTLGLSLLFILWMSPAVSTRTYIMKNKDVEYVQATRTLGGSQARIIFLHMIPVVAGRISVIFVNLIPTVIFYESTLVFLGLKSTSDISLGVMLYDAYTVSNISQIVSPIVVFASFTISAQIIANALNDAIDPRVVGR